MNLKPFFLTALLLFTLNFRINTLSAHEHSPMVLRTDTFGGFVDEASIGYMRSIHLHLDGNLYLSTKANHNSPTITQKLAKLSPERVSLIIEAINNFDPNAELIYPDSPICTDSPITQYLAFNSNGVKIMYAQNIWCQLGLLTGYYQPKLLVEFIDGWESLLSLP